MRVVVPSGAEPAAEGQGWVRARVRVRVRVRVTLQFL